MKSNKKEEMTKKWSQLMSGYWVPSLIKGMHDEGDTGGDIGMVSFFYPHILILWNHVRWLKLFQ